MNSLNASLILFVPRCSRFSALSFAEELKILLEDINRICIKLATSIICNRSNCVRTRISIYLSIYRFTVALSHSQLFEIGILAIFHFHYKFFTCSLHWRYCPSKRKSPKLCRYVTHIRCCLLLYVI